MTGIRRKLGIGIALATAIAALGIGQSVLDQGAQAQGATVEAPMFEVDPLWPKPLPNHWVLGSAIGVYVDTDDHVWIIHRKQALSAETEASAGRNAPKGECCSAAPPVLEFDAAGNLAERWPENPNGSARAVAGVCDSTGRILGLMPHPDAFLYPWHHPDWPRRRADLERRLQQ